MKESIIDRIIAAKEGQTFETKRAKKKPSEILPTICALANTGGGIFIYGVAETILTERFARNPIIERTLSRMPNPPNLDIGEGVNRMFNEMEKKNLYAPLYAPRKFTPHSVCVILLNEEKVRYWDIVEKYLAKHKQITNKELCSIVELDTLKASDLLKKWTKQRLLEKVGRSKRKTAYRKPFTKPQESEDLLEGIV